MEEQLISFKTAKLAKEKGFNEPCAGFIELKHHDTLLFIDDDILYVYPNYNPLKEHHKILDDGWYLAPTQSLLQKWLRDKFNIHVDPHPVISVDENGNIDYIKGWDCIVEYVIIGQDCNDYEVCTICNTYEEALEEGLKKALTLIKIK